jgi:hypothetical protein
MRCLLCVDLRSGLALLGEWVGGHFFRARSEVALCGARP